VTVEATGHGDACPLQQTDIGAAAVLRNQKIAAAVVAAKSECPVDRCQRLYNGSRIPSRKRTLAELLRMTNTKRHSLDLISHFLLNISLEAP
jgi:hypothetical protein